LKDLGIVSITKTKTSNFSEYTIEQVGGNKIVLQDFTDVRYDFEKDTLRKTESNESVRMREEVDIFLGMTKKIMELTK